MSKHEPLVAHLRSLEDYRCNLAADALEAQARQITDMQQQESELCTLHAMAEAECKKLRAEIEALRKDAERYRWLREPSLAAGQGSITVELDDRANGHFSRSIFLAELDAAIDAARARLEGKP